MKQMRMARKSDGNDPGGMIKPIANTDAFSNA